MRGIWLYPLIGYLFLRDVVVGYVLDEEGVMVMATVTKRGERSCPYGCGQYPYLSSGEGLIDDAVLCFVAGIGIVTDPRRQLLTGIERVAGGRFGFS